MWTTLLIIAYSIINLFAFYFLLRNGNKPYRIWAWMMTILALPIIGGILYFIIGVNRRKRKLFNLKKIIDKEQTETFLKKYINDIDPNNLQEKSITTYYQKLINLLLAANKTPLTFNNKVSILQNGKETFDAIFSACENAKKTIYIEYYIFENGKLADRFLSIFLQKLKEGVSIYFIYDGLGSWSLDNDYINTLKEAGAKVFGFLPVRLAVLAKTNYRNHRKILVIDGTIGFTGGINVDDKYIDGDPELGHWTDTHLRIEGMAVNFLKFLFFNDWYFVSNENLFTEKALQIIEPVGTTPVQIVASGPDSQHATILYEYLTIVEMAEKYLYIANPYLIPTESLLLALKASALSGVDVRIIIPETSDSVIVKWAVRSYFEPLLNCGVKIYLYQPGFLHSKIILSDDKICSIGTANLDIRSFEQNFEVNALIYDATITKKLKNQFNNFIEKSTKIDLENYKKRGRVQQIKENLARLVSPVI